jgi:hypothetical protein
VHGELSRHTLGNLRKNVQWVESCRIIMNLNFRDDERILKRATLKFPQLFYMFFKQNKKKESSVFSHPYCLRLLVLWDC